jgi:hypothetical protein
MANEDQNFLRELARRISVPPAGSSDRAPMLAAC